MDDANHEVVIEGKLDMKQKVESQRLDEINDMGNFRDLHLSHNVSDSWTGG